MARSTPNEMVDTLSKIRITKQNIRDFFFIICPLSCGFKIEIFRFYNITTVVAKGRWLFPCKPWKWRLPGSDFKPHSLLKTILHIFKYRDTSAMSRPDFCRRKSQFVKDILNTCSLASIFIGPRVNRGFDYNRQRFQRRAPHNKWRSNPLEFTNTLRPAANPGQTLQG